MIRSIGAAAPYGTSEDHRRHSREYIGQQSLLASDGPRDWREPNLFVRTVQQMPTQFQILGGPRQDNGLYAEIDTGQSISRLLFDCGEGIPTAIPYGDLIQLQHLFLTHCHMDHLVGLSGFLRRVYANERQTPVIWGPPGTAVRVQFQLRAFLWNLVADQANFFVVNDVSESEVISYELRLNEGYGVLRERSRSPRRDVLVSGDGYDVSAIEMDHGTPCLAFVVREHGRSNVDTTKLVSMGLRPGPWMKQLKSGEAGDGTVDVGGVPTPLASLREQLLVQTPGASIAYCTDFLLDDVAEARLVPFLRGVDTLVCESQYRRDDADLALANRHMTCTQVARLARQAGVGKLVLIHISDRYDSAARRELLAEARAEFLLTDFPEGWTVDFW